MSDRWLVTVAQIAHTRAAESDPAPRPRRPYAVIDGSTTDDVLTWLRARSPRRWWTLGEIIDGVGGRHPKCVSWAIWSLSSRGLVERIGDHGRHARYCRYRAVIVRSRGGA